MATGDSGTASGMRGNISKCAAQGKSHRIDSQVMLGVQSKIGAQKMKFVLGGQRGLGFESKTGSLSVLTEVFP